MLSKSEHKSKIEKKVFPETKKLKRAKDKMSLVSLKFHV